MDIVLCALKTVPVSQSPETYYMQYSGANNPLFIVTGSGELKVIEPDKQPVAIYEKMKSFTNHEILLNKGDCLYLVSDGFQDQFGGINRRKFMVKQLKELLKKISGMNMNEQQKILEDSFNSWKGDNEQIDDVTILGLRI
jgi:serine phosphatase RsbU (regulator of sigma subunit)